MRQKIVLIGLLLSFTFVAVPNSQSQWIRMSGPSAASCFAQIGNSLFAGTNGGGVFLLTDIATGWQPVNTGLTNKAVLVLAVSGTNLFAGTRGGGVFLSTNSGTSWTETNAGLVNKNVYSLSVSGTNIYAGTGASTGIFHSTNDGTTWTLVKGITETWLFLSLATNGKNLFAGTHGRVFTTTDDGTSWADVSAGLENDSYIGCFMANGTHLYAGTADHGVYLSTDNGGNWTAMNSGLSQYISANSLVVNGSKLFAAVSDNYATIGYTGVFLSTDSGANWTSASPGLNDASETVVNGLAVFGANIFAATDKKGIWYRPLSEFDAGSAGVAHTDPIALEISPNPTTGIVTVRDLEEGNVHITLANILGQRVMEMDQTHASQFSIDLSKFPSGSYDAKFVSEKSIVTKVIVKD